MSNLPGRVDARAEARDHGRSYVVGDGTMIINPDLERAPAAPVLVRIPAPEAAPPAVFCGREEEAETLLGCLDPAANGPVITVLHGLAGVGKTALAWQVASATVGRGWFPGGAVLTDLRGYVPHARIDADQVYAPLLRALGAAGGYVPATTGEQAAVYHRMLEALAEQSRPVLLLLDNCADPDQVAGLLPTHRAHRVLVTSQDHLGALPHRLTAVPLDVLDIAAAMSLLEEELRQRDHADRRVSRHPEQARELARMCGGLPLALRITGALLGDDPGLTLAELVEEFTDVRSRLDILDEVAASFELSWQHLVRRDAPAARILPRLALNPGPDLSVDVAAALAGQDLPAVRRQLRTLRRAHLVEHDPVTRRWRMHDLVRLFAGRLAEEQVCAADRDAAFGRLLAHYQDGADTVAARAEPHLTRHTRPGAITPRHYPALAQRTEALHWFERESANLLACLDQASAGDHLLGAGREVVALTDAVAGCLRNDGPWEVAIRLHRQAAGIAERLGDPVAQATALNDLGIMCRLIGDHGQARQALTRAHRIFADPTGPRAADPRVGLLGQANALHESGIVATLDERHGDATALLDQALALYQRVPDPIGVANAAKNLGVARHRLGEVGRAAALLELAGDTYREIGDLLGEAEVDNHLGLLLRRSGAPDAAWERFHAAVELARLTSSLLEQARALEGMGCCRGDAGDLAGAGPLLRQAGGLFNRIGAVTDATRVARERARLGLSDPPGPR